MFSGTGSVAAVYKAAGYEVVTMDRDRRWGTDIVEDIFTWDYRTYDPGHFHTITASPQCT